ncbi:fibroblast growth factor 4 [Lampris incognitus]|uniref:fibroblast growth factor 4 n=1 Tax=Lampris incognitus TaxID=2546036 RepID=UPI0024B54716|nr:fibroblast growth factor 4 [Lampris incognitus]
MPIDQGSHLQSLWKMHMRDSKLKGQAGSQPHLVKGTLKQQLLYCRVGIGYHLHILSNGSVGGVHKPTEHCMLRVFAMKRGVVGIQGVKSGLYLCMTGGGIAYGAEKFSDDCLFKENLEENHYTTYSSLSHSGMYLALSHKGQIKKGNKVSRHQPCTHFLPRRT